MAGEPPEFGYLQSDEPIQRASDDRLGRSYLADAIADQALNSPSGQGFVIAIDGPWGSGKTSVLNMVEERVNSTSSSVVVRFNPWLFSNTEELIVRFIHELSAQLEGYAGQATNAELKVRLSEIGTRLSSYGDVLVPFGWIPVAGPWLARAGALSKAIGGTTGKKKQSVSVLAQQSAVRDALAKLECRVIVFLDDLDRVEQEQTRDVLRLIKLVADFPNVTYLLAYDGSKVAAAIGPSIEEGRAYLEKIVQVIHAVPEISDELLVRLLQEELGAVTSHIKHGPFSEEEWVNVFYTGMKPFFQTMRDARRYLNTVPVTLRVLGDEVALVDALALETLRIFAPAAFAKLPSLVGVLTGERAALIPQEDEKGDKAAIEEFVAACSPHQEAGKELIHRLFPRVGRYLGGYNVIGDGQRLRRDRRVAHPEVLRVYLRQTIAEGAPTSQLVREAYDVMGDEARFTALLDALSPQQVEDLLGRLEDYESEYEASAAEVACVVLLNQLPRMREGRRGMFDAGGDLAVTRVVLRALKAVKGEDECAEVVRSILPRVDQLSGRQELLNVVGRRKDPTDLMIPSAVAEELYAKLDTDVLGADPATLANERHLVALFYQALNSGGDEAEARGRVAALLEDDAVFLRLLRSAASERQTQSMGSVAVRSTLDIGWDGLVAMTPGADWLKRRVHEIAGRVDRSGLDERTKLALEVAEKYASGELPNEDRFGS